MKRQTFNYLVIAALFIAAVFTSCSKDKDSDPYAGHPILGTWSHYNTIGDFTKYYTFYADGTGIFKTEGGSKIQSTFTWAISGTKVTITNTGGNALLSMASEIFFDSSTNKFYDVRYSSLLYTKQ